MGRSGYTDECENLWLWRGAVLRAMSGKRGQAALRDLATALDKMPEKKLAAHSFQRGGDPCSWGALALHRGVDMADLEPEVDHEWGAEMVDRDLVGSRLDVAPAMAAEVMFMNDEGCYGVETPQERWLRMRAWVAKNLKVTA